MKTLKKPLAAPPEKLDLLKLHAADYVSPRKPVFLDIAPARYLAIAGTGAPGGKEFEDSIGGLYAMAFGVKLSRKFAGLGDYCISKLEAVYPKLGAEGAGWAWKLLIRTPDCVTSADLEKTLATLRSRGNEGAAARVFLETLAEGTCVQLLHVGPYDEEARSFELMRAFAAERGCEPAGEHHEIYISDPRRVEASKLKTILRLPLRPRA